MKASEIIVISVICVLMLAWIVSVIYRAHVRKTGKRVDPWVDIVINDIPRLMLAVESVLPTGHGSYKLDDVKTKVRAICSERHIKYDDSIVSKAVAKYMSAGNEINRGKMKPIAKNENTEDVD